MQVVHLTEHIASFCSSALSPWSSLEPWELTAQSEAIVRQLLAQLPSGEFNFTGGLAVHRSATVESGAVLKEPLILSAGCFVAAGAYLRGGNWVAENCIFGPGSELKSSFVFPGTKLAHFNFVGDSLLGTAVNFEAGSVICNYRNERSAKEVLVRTDKGLHFTGQEKFGALVGDGSRIGANAVIAPGAILPPGTVIRRTALHDHECLVPSPRG